MNGILKNVTEAVLDLSHQLGREERRLAILGEGNTSARVSDAAFVVKASGSNLATLSASQLSLCCFDRLLSLLDTAGMSDEEVDSALLAARADESSRKPSVEALFHAWLLSLPGIHFVGHTHPVSVNAILCSEYAGRFAHHRLFPDEIVCCGTESVLVPYTDPGLKLAQAIKMAVEEFIRRRDEAPRIILLENHGLIALGATPAAVLAGTLMTSKAAEIFLGAASLGAPPRYLTDDQVRRIAGRPDEHYRQRALGL